jgi:hypothetical protein
MPVAITAAPSTNRRYTLADDMVEAAGNAVTAAGP